MYCVRKVTNDSWWVGASDRRLALFENVYPIPRGVSYNSYLVLDEKTVLLDTVDKSVSGAFFENVEHVLNGRGLDYLIVNHMEPDHSATIGELLLRYPQVTLVCNAKTLGMLGQFFHRDLSGQTLLVKEGDSLCTGAHTFSFYMAPMVHWPEVMVTYDSTDKALYSADAFGTFGSLDGNLFADEVNFDRDWLDDARRYYVNIVGKYGVQVTALLKKAAGLDIAVICPLHGPVWRKNLGYYIEKYRCWGSYQPEDRAVAIFSGSIYGNTERAAEVTASLLSQGGVRDVRLYDVSAVHPSQLLAEAFRCSHIILACSTYNSGIFTPMETLLHELLAHQFQNRAVAVIQNGTWGPTAGGLMQKLLEGCKNLTVLEPMVTIRSTLCQEQLPELEALAQAVIQSL